MYADLLQIYENLPVEEFWKSVKIWQNYGHEFGVQFFWPVLYMWYTLIDDIH